MEKDTYAGQRAHEIQGKIDALLRVQRNRDETILLFLKGSL